MNPLQLLPPEAAHLAAIWALRHLPTPRASLLDERLASQLWGLEFPNPLGMAAGFDKQAEAYNALLSLGFGFVEVGSITPKAQPGNPKPRVFRLREDQAVINRYGFNSQGIDPALSRLEAAPAKGIIGINLGKNKETEETERDYCEGIRLLGPHAAYLVANVSSPNTPGLRAVQRQELLRPLVVACQATRDTLPHRPPLLVKIAPDLEPEDLEAIADMALSLKLDGLIVSNTTLERPASLRGAAKGEAGGLSGVPLFERSTEVLRSVARLTKGEVALIGVGGVHDADTAYAKIKAGASLLQLYSALTYQGPRLITDILKGLLERMERDGLSHISQAIGQEV